MHFRFSWDFFNAQRFKKNYLMQRQRFDYYLTVVNFVTLKFIYLWYNFLYFSTTPTIYYYICLQNGDTKGWEVFSLVTGQNISVTKEWYNNGWAYVRLFFPLFLSILVSRETVYIISGVPNHYRWHVPHFKYIFFCLNFFNGPTDKSINSIDFYHFLFDNPYSMRLIKLFNITKLH